MAYADNTVNIYENEVERRLRLELERMMKYKNVSDSLSKVEKNRDLLTSRAELESFVKSGLSDTSKMPLAKNKISLYSKNNPEDKSYIRQVGLDLLQAEDLNIQKQNAITALNTAFTQADNLDPVNRVSSDVTDKIYNDIDAAQNRASERHMHQLISSSNTREDKMKKDWKRSGQLLNQFQSFQRRTDVEGEPLDQARLDYGILSNIENLIQQGQLEKASNQMGEAKVVKPNQVSLGYKNDKGEWQFGTRVGTSGFQTEEVGKNPDGSKKFDWVYKKDEEGNPIIDRNGRPTRKVKEGYLDNLEGYEGQPIRVNSQQFKKYGTPVSTDTKVTASESIILGAFKSEAYPNGIEQFNDGSGGKLYAESIPNDDGTTRPGHIVPAKVKNQILMGHKKRNDLMRDQKAVEAINKTNAEGEVEGKWNSLQSIWDASPLNVDSKTTVSSNAQKFQDMLSTDFMGKNTWFDKEELSSKDAIKTKQDDLLRFMSDHMKESNNFNDWNTHIDLKKAYNSEEDAIKGAHAVFLSPKWKAMMNSSNPQEQVMRNFDLYGWDSSIGEDYDDDTESQAALMVAVYEIWSSMEKRRGQLLNIDSTQEAPRPE